VPEPEPEPVVSKPIAVKPTTLLTDHRMSDFGGRFKPFDLSALTLLNSPMGPSDGDNSDDDGQMQMYVLGGIM
jgi:hypothetical protein